MDASYKQVISISVQMAHTLYRTVRVSCLKNTISEGLSPTYPACKFFKTLGCIQVHKWVDSLPFIFDSHKPKFTNSLNCLNLFHSWSLLTVPLFRAEVVCWTIFLGSFLCFLSTDRSGGQGSLLSKSAATRTETDATASCPFTH